MAIDMVQTLMDEENLSEAEARKRVNDPEQPLFIPANGEKIPQAFLNQQLCVLVFSAGP